MFELRKSQTVLESQNQTYHISSVFSRTHMDIAPHDKAECTWLELFALFKVAQNKPAALQRGNWYEHEIGIFGIIWWN